MPTQHDIIIIGAGMVGLCLAKLLSELPLSIAVIEAHEIPEWTPDSYSLRVSALSLASQRILERAGVWSAISHERVSPYTDMRVWEQGIDSPEALHFSSSDIKSDIGTKALGCIVENDLIRDRLQNSIKQMGKITWYVPDRLDNISISETAATVNLKSAVQLQAKLVIAADGANSVTRRKLKLSEVSRSYSQYGVVAQLKTELPHAQTAYQRFHDQEVLGLLPLANGNCSMVWSCSQAKAESLLAVSKSELAGRIEEFCQNILGEMIVIDEAQGFPLQLLHSRQYVSERVVLCGDAAHAVHPLAGQGVNLGLLDAMALVDVLTTGWRKNYDLGDLSLLREYERTRKGNNVRMMTVLDILFRLFQSTNPVLQQVRRFGMGIVDKAGPVKTRIIEQALGLTNIN